MEGKDDEELLPFPAVSAAGMGPYPVSLAASTCTHSYRLRSRERHRSKFQTTVGLRGPEKVEIGRLAFLRPFLGDLGATYDDHLRLIGKRVVDFLLC